MEAAGAPWPPSRRRKPAPERREQLQRAEARRLLHVARALGQLDNRRGQQLCLLGRALQDAIRGLHHRAPNNEAPAPSGAGVGFWDPLGTFAAGAVGTYQWGEANLQRRRAKATKYG